MRTASRKRKIELGKQERRHQAVQIRQRKRDEVLSKKRMLGGLDAAPFLGNQICVCVLKTTTIKIETFSLCFTIASTV